MKTRTKYELIPIYRVEDIPDFKNEDEEHDFWSTHEFSDELWEHAELSDLSDLPEPRREAKPR